MTIENFLHDLQSKQILRQTDGQTLNCRMATLFTMIPPEKKDLSNRKNMKIGAFVKNLSMNKHYYIIYIHMCIQTNCITFLPFEVGQKRIEANEMPIFKSQLTRKIFISVTFFFMYIITVNRIYSKLIHEKNSAAKYV